MTSGIYKITNCATGKSYIGQSKNIEKRINDHIMELDTGSHHNKDLQEDWIYYDFEWTIIEETRPNRDILNKREIFWITYFDTKRNGYNQTRGGDFYEGSDSEIGNDKWKVCSRCGKRINGVAKSCPYCYSTSFSKYHEPMPVKESKSKWKICMGCGKKVNRTAKGCPYCYSASFYQYQEAEQIHENKNKWTKCPECGKKVNRVATGCPYCGYKF